MIKRLNSLKELRKQLAENSKNSVSMGLTGVASDILSGKLSAESGDNSALGSFYAEMDSVIGGLQFGLESDSFGSKDKVFTSAQKAAVKLIAPFAQDVVAAAKAGFGYNLIETRGGDVISPESIGIYDALGSSEVQANMNKLAMEAYDGQKLSNSNYFTIAFNLHASVQDEFGETLFPTVTINPEQSGIEVEMSLASFMSDFTRSITGEPDADKFNKIPMIKSAYNEAILGMDKNRVIPVLRTSGTTNSSKFLVAQKYSTKDSGELVETAPLLFGEDVSLLGVSQPNAMLAKGDMDFTDALDRTVTLESVYLSVTGNTDKKSTFKFNTEMFQFSNFVDNPQDHNKGMIMNFHNKGGFVITVGVTKDAAGGDAGSTTNGAFGGTVGSAVFATTYANYKVLLDVNINGRLNVQSSDINVSAGGVKVYQIYDAAGNVVTDTAALAAFKTIFDTLKLEGYVVKAFRTNSNIRTRGLITTTDSYNKVYNVPVRSGTTSVFPISNSGGTDNDANVLGSHIDITGLKTSMGAVKAIDNFASQMNFMATNGQANQLAFHGIGGYLVDRYFATGTLQLSEIVDSIQSSNKVADISAALQVKLTYEAINMSIKSNYAVAHRTLRGGMGGKITVAIATDPVLAHLILGGSSENKFSMSPDLDAIVVSTLNPIMSGKIYMTFVVMDENRNTTPNPLNFGNMVWAPTLAYEIQVTRGGSTSRELHSNPRYEHFIHLPILSAFSVSDVNNVLGKIVINTAPKTRS